MAIIRRYWIAGLCLLFVVLSVNTTGAALDIRDPFNKKTRNSITGGVLDKRITIVPQLNKLNFGLGKYGGESFYFKKSLSKIFFQDHTIDVTVTDIEFEEVKINLHLFHSILGDGTLQFVFDLDLLSRISAADLQTILLTSVGHENNLYVFADPESKIYHSYTCLHTKNEDKLRRMTKTEAELQGYRECSFCFRKVLYLPDLAVEKQIAKEWSELLQSYDSLIDDSERRIKIRDVGYRILENWPFPLLGYEYSFYLVKSSEMSAIAIPTGKIVISTALFEALENEQELEALLLLAIAHIELRHSLRQRRIKLAAARNSDAVQQLVRAAGSVAGMFPGGGLINTLGALPVYGTSNPRSSISDFEEDFNREADAIAALYFDLNHGNRHDLIAFIHKMQVERLTKELHPEFGTGQDVFRFNDRIKRVKNTRFLYFSDEKSYIWQEKDQIPVQLNFLYQRILGDENSLVVYINDRSLISGYYKGLDQKTVSLRVRDKKGTLIFRLLEKFTTEDQWGAQLTFKALGKKNGHFIQNSKSITLELISPNPTSITSEEIPEQIVRPLRFVKGKLKY